MHLLVVGATGQVGRQLLQLARRDSRFQRTTGTSRASRNPALRLDLRDAASVRKVLAEVGPSHVALTAAETNVTWSEVNTTDAHRINVEGTAAVADACRDLGAKLAFFSSDYVFDGRDGPYPESARPNPINVYGSQKLEAEAIVLAADSHSLIVRTCQVFGPDVRRRNYVLSVVDQLRGAATVHAATDLYGTPTFAPDLARVVLDLFCAEASGVWHAAGETFLSRYELARLAAQAFGVDTSRLEGGPVDAKRETVNRPRKAGLRSDRNDVAIRTMRPLEEALALMAEVDRP